MIDIHTHILPEMDDGAESVDMSIQMLIEMKKNGVDKVYATPHYYPTELIDEFLKRREESYQKLLKGLENIDKSLVPEIKLGAEVYYNHFLIINPDLKKLKFKDEDLLLLELPWETWTDQVISDTEILQKNNKFNIVLAHLERYYDITGAKYVKKVLKLGCLIQMNANYIINEKTRKEALKQYKKNKVSYIASDCHNMTSRRPNVWIANDILNGAKK